MTQRRAQNVLKDQQQNEIKVSWNLFFKFIANDPGVTLTFPWKSITTEHCRFLEIFFKKYIWEPWRGLERLQNSQLKVPGWILKFSLKHTSKRSWRLTDKGRPQNMLKESTQIDLKVPLNIFKNSWQYDPWHIPWKPTTKCPSYLKIREKKNRFFKFFFKKTYLKKTWTGPEVFFKNLRTNYRFELFPKWHRAGLKESTTNWTKSFFEYF